VYFGDTHPAEDVMGTSEKSERSPLGCPLGLPDFRSSFSAFFPEKIGCFFMHVKGRALDPSGFSAPLFGLLATWWEPQIWRDLKLDPSILLSHMPTWPTKLINN
jgi:hypothetical protein